MSLFDGLWRDTATVRPLLERSDTGTPVYGESRQVKCRLYQSGSGDADKAGEQLTCAYRLLTGEKMQVGDLVETAMGAYPIKKVTRHRDVFGSAAYWEAAL